MSNTKGAERSNGGINKGSAVAVHPSTPPPPPSPKQNPPSPPKPSISKSNNGK